jgi:hypothetical protein
LILKSHGRALGRLLTNKPIGARRTAAYLAIMPKTAYNAAEGTL